MCIHSFMISVYCRHHLLFQNKGTCKKAVATKRLLSGSSIQISHARSASHHCCRYYLLFQNKGTGEKAVATQQWTAGLATKEALEVEEPMWQELGLTETMKDPDAITGGINWYR